MCITSGKVVFFCFANLRGLYARILQTQFYGYPLRGSRKSVIKRFSFIMSAMSYLYIGSQKFFIILNNDERKLYTKSNSDLSGHSRKDVAERFQNVGNYDLFLHQIRIFTDQLTLINVHVYLMQI